MPWLHYNQKATSHHSELLLSAFGSVGCFLCSIWWAGASFDQLTHRMRMPQADKNCTKEKSEKGGWLVGQKLRDLQPNAASATTPLMSIHVDDIPRHTCRDYTTTKRLHLITQSSFCPPLARLDVSCVASGGLEHRLTTPLHCPPPRTV